MSDDLTLDDVFDRLANSYDAEAAGDWNATIHFEISGDNGGDWSLLVEDGCEVKKGKHGDPSLTIQTDDETYLGIAQGDVNAQMAFMTGKIKADDMSQLMKFQSVFDL